MPTAAPQPTAAPTEAPTAAPTATVAPTEAPTAAPTATAAPTEAPTATAAPTAAPKPTTTPKPTAASKPAAAQVTIKLFQFQPSPITVKPGTRVVWTNDDDIEHSVTSGAPPDGNGAFDSGFFGKGQTFAMTFQQPGDYPYFCRRHPSMMGMVTVAP
jgi:plastocyanin